MQTPQFASLTPNSDRSITSAGPSEDTNSLAIQKRRDTKEACSSKACSTSDSQVRAVLGLSPHLLLCIMGQRAELQLLFRTAGQFEDLPACMRRSLFAGCDALHGLSSSGITRYKARRLLRGCSTSEMTERTQLWPLSTAGQILHFRETIILYGRFPPESLPDRNR